ncbi:hypothetical protein PoB_007475800 [Plakobranchus ocellatus]|uniref:Uncharacterized protein n=1 Tax=Plakobranchus ocellatus TaxID=259542 RepID=A0AAV4DV53_9GAST|nr:hypothetical protein PoB_007475800 [Plakobranchus ocellatus]
MCQFEGLVVDYAVWIVCVGVEDDEVWLTELAPRDSFSSKQSDEENELNRHVVFSSSTSSHSMIIKSNMNYDPSLQAFPVFCPVHLSIEIISFIVTRADPTCLHHST